MVHFKTAAAIVCSLAAPFHVQRRIIYRIRKVKARRNQCRTEIEAGSAGSVPKGG
jgi:hypothetical protein